MPWFRNYPDARRVKGAKSVLQSCENCKNRCEFHLFRCKSGLGLGIGFTGRMFVSTRTDWLMVCSICAHSYDIEKIEAKQLQKRESDNSSHRIDYEFHDQQNSSNIRGNSGNQFSGNCRKCGNQTSGLAKFCSACGEYLTK